MGSDCFRITISDVDKRGISGHLISWRDLLGLDMAILAAQDTLLEEAFVLQLP